MEAKLSEDHLEVEKKTKEPEKISEDSKKEELQNKSVLSSSQKANPEEVSEKDILLEEGKMEDIIGEVNSTTLEKKGEQKKNPQIPSKWIYPTLTCAFEGKTQTFLVSKELIYVGRGPKNQLSIPDKNLSQVHCKIYREKNFWYLEDCESRNGTFLNGKKLGAGKRKRLMTHSFIQLGLRRLEFCFPRARKEPLVPTLWSRIKVSGFFLCCTLWHWLMLFLASLFVMWNVPVSDRPLIVGVYEAKEIGEVEENSDFNKDSLFNEMDISEESAQDDFEEVLDSQRDISNEVAFENFTKTNSQKNPLSAKKFGQKIEGLSSGGKGRSRLVGKVGRVDESISILNVTGRFDFTNRVLEQLGIKYKTISFPIFFELLLCTKEKPYQGIDAHKLPAFLSPEKHLIILNCGTPKIFSLRHQEMLRRFIGQGGYLISTDWALEYLARSFPRHLKNNKIKVTGVFPVEVNPECGSHLLLRDLKKSKKQFSWWFEASSWVPTLVSKDIKVLVTKGKTQPVALTFRYKHKAKDEKSYQIPGRILHYVSHLYQQEYVKEGAYNLQMILVNFILLKQREYAHFYSKAILEGDF